jgi:hypothetical protein
LDGQQVKQLVIQESHRNITMKGIHNDAGHQGKGLIDKGFIGLVWRRTF